MCDINQMGGGEAVPETAVMTTVDGARLLLPYRNGTDVPRLFLVNSLVLYVSVCGLSYLCTYVMC